MVIEEETCTMTVMSKGKIQCSRGKCNFIRGLVFTCVVNSRRALRCRDHAPLVCLGTAVASVVAVSDFRLIFIVEQLFKPQTTIQNVSELLLVHIKLTKWYYYERKMYKVMLRCAAKLYSSWGAIPKFLSFNRFADFSRKLIFESSLQFRCMFSFLQNSAVI